MSSEKRCNASQEGVRRDFYKAVICAYSKRAREISAMTDMILRFSMARERASGNESVTILPVM